MYASLFVTALLAVQPAATPLSPIEVLDVVRFNAAATDDAILHRVVELTGEVTEIYRDGIGGYVVRLDWPVDPNVRIDVKDCTLAAAEAVSPPATTSN